MPWMLVTFAALVAFFHLSEVLLVWAFNREELSWQSALFSGSYVAMLVLTIVEFEVESRYAPWLKQPAVSIAGLVLAVAGEALRKAAMVTARRAFTHEIAEHKRDGHVLVTTGVYRVIRHPGYLGWFLWAIGAQLVLCNPIATVLAAVFAWRFFAERIPYEEARLRRFFPGTYDAYRARTRTWIPFIA
jgi:protein-S-isoprenylcysteine O-methyltransferase